MRQLKSKKAEMVNEPRVSFKKASQNGTLESKGKPAEELVILDPKIIDKTQESNDEVIVDQIRSFNALSPESTQAKIEIVTDELILEDQSKRLIEVSHEATLTKNQEDDEAMLQSKPTKYKLKDEIKDKDQQ